MVVEKCCASEFWRENNYSADNTTAIAVIFKTRPDPIDTPTKEAIQEKAEMDAAVAAAEKAMEGIGMPDDDEEEEAPKFRRNRSSGGGGSSELADSGSEAGSGVASEGMHNFASRNSNINKDQLIMISAGDQQKIS